MNVGQCTPDIVGVRDGCPSGGTTRGSPGKVEKRIVEAWRELTSKRVGRRAGKGEATLIACSGGADSCALVLALVGAVGGASKAGRNGTRVVVAHVVHDLRGRSEALADRDAVRGLAQRLGVEFVEAEVVARGRGMNLEASARKERYRALIELARAKGIRYLATGHQADDQLETMLMALVRGAGPRGMWGMACKRCVWKGESEREHVWLIRPMLHPEAKVTREEARDVCRRAGVEWREDATNQDVSRARAAIRHRVVPELEKLRSGVAGRSAVAATLLRESTKVLDRAVARVVRRAEQKGGVMRWSRAYLRGREGVVLGGVLRAAHREVSEGLGGEDRLAYQTIGRAVRAIRDDSTDPRVCRCGRVDVEVTASSVAVRRVSGRP